MGKLVYKVKDDVTFKTFKRNGYKELTANMAGVPLLLDDVAYKTIVQGKKSEPVQFLINLYNSEEYQKNYLKTIEGVEFEEVYDEDGNRKLKVFESKELYDIIKKWRVEVNFSDEEKWLCFTISNQAFPISFCAKEMLDKYCKREVERLKKLGLIEEFEVVDHIEE